MGSTPPGDRFFIFGLPTFVFVELFRTGPVTENVYRPDMNMNTNMKTYKLKLKDGWV